MNKPLQQIIPPFLLVLIMLISPLNVVIAINKQAGQDETLQKRVSKWMDETVLGFEENKGQFSDGKGNPVPDLLFKINAKGMDMYVTTSGIIYLFNKRTKVKAENTAEEAKKNHEDMKRRIQ